MANIAQVDIKAIQREIKKKPIYAEPLRVLAHRKRGRNEITFRKMYRDLRAGVFDAKTSKVYVKPQDWSAEDIRAFFELLESSGAGKIVMGPDTPEFVFKYELRSIARASLNMQDASSPTPASIKPKPPSRRQFAKVGSEGQSSLQSSAVILTREGLTIELQADIAQMSPEALTKMSEILKWFKKT